ncbi:alginate lyase family protein [Ancylomarina sp. 16SWW S1-10-2]|uniref:alginate lyase family protein n=1 Tax=Ancylomarina sp. 16SWW S1-10-2 TaxID=2499681 RepID=UPI0018A00935|nr:alginate lyase family protein [Ancylomarina sp. 16SWW S1-10-2]
MNQFKIKIRLLVKFLFVVAVSLVSSIQAFSKETCSDSETKANISLESKVLSLPAKANEIVTYKFELKNSLDRSQTFHLSIKKVRELACKAILSDSVITINPQGKYFGVLHVTVSDRIPVGGQENITVLVKNSKNKEVDNIQFITVRATPHPFLLVTNEILEEAKEKVKNNAWAKENLTNMLKSLNEFKFPKRRIVTKPRPTQVWSSLSYIASDGERAFQLCLAYKLTDDVAYRDKAIHFIKQVCDKEEGYLSVGAATTGVQVHEGNFFLFLAAACDIVYNESSFSEEDRENINNTFRYYLQQNKGHMSSLGIMNHQASANAGAIVAALFLQDVAEVNYLIDADGGMADQLSKGIMADGWWFESTINYCHLVTQRYVLVAQAFENFGWDLYHRRFPVEYKSKDFVNAKEGFTGMKFDNWGPTGRNTRGVEDMVAAYIPMMDENAWVVSSNDSRLTKPDIYYELAYRHYRTDELAWVVGKSDRDSWVSLLYGIPNLPDVKDPRTKSTFAPNVGLVALRSQGTEQKPEEQIQAYFKFGTHGGWHGQFDRTGMLALDRFGHKFFGTEMAWFGYGDAGYKECVQTSATHNMVVVDELQQEAVPSEQPLFYAGKMMQVSVTETNARWRKIPIFNIEKFPPWNDSDFETEPILQRRLSVVTDDYVVIVDYLKASKKHSFDWMLHPVGFQSIKGATKKGKVHPMLSTFQTSPYKYFTNAQWYQMKNGAQTHFLDEGVSLDIHTLWPKKAGVVVANYPIGGKHSGIKNNPNRRTLGVRIEAKEALYVTVLEPHKGESVIDKIESLSPQEIRVSLKDGRKQIISIDNLKGNSKDIQVQISETLNGTDIRTETTEQ